ncbi:MAG: S8 family serine peptidase, partial [Candidatus Uhrbacteria bacterium]|nr:S8 family serine peptidase [Candidatus Uhrbacteria bacterium]
MDIAHADADSTYVRDEIIVKYKEKVINVETSLGRAAARKFAVKRSLETKEDIGRNNVSLFKIRDNKTVKQKIDELRADPSVEYVQPNYQYFSREIATDDMSRGLLWGLDNSGQAVNGVTGVNDADIDAPEAWALNEGTNGSVVVAVIDTGVDYNHSDLAANMWDGSSCKDENGAALGGCNHGYDYASDDRDPLPVTSSHGTHVAGTIAAVKGNGLGVVGVAPRAKIMAIRSTLTSANAVKGINFAKQNGADVVNASWGSYGTDAEHFDTALYNAIRDFDGLFIVAAGNARFDHDDGVDLHKSYPDGFTIDTTVGPALPNIITVAATDQNDSLAYFSDYGSRTVDVGAPGTNILSTVIGGYSYYNGTSMAAPHVVGLAALIQGYNPTLTTAQIKNIILTSGDSLTTLNGKTTTGKRINAEKALRAATSQAVGTLTISLDSATPSAAQAVAGTTPGAGALLLRLGASVEDVRVKDVTFRTMANEQDVAVRSATLWKSSSAVGPWTQVGGDFILNADGANPGYLRYSLTGSDITVSRSSALFLLLKPTYASFSSAEVSGVKPAFILADLQAEGIVSSVPLSAGGSGLINSTGVVAQSNASATYDNSNEKTTMTGLSATATTLVTENRTLFTAGDIVFIDEDNGGDWDSSTEELMVVLADGGANLSMSRAVFGTVAGTYTAGKNIYRLDNSSSRRGVAGNATTILNTKLTLDVGGSPSGEMSGGIAKEVLRFTARAQENSADGRLNTARITRIDITASKLNASVQHVVVYPIESVGIAAYQTSCLALSQQKWRCIMNTTDFSNEIVEGESRTYSVRADVGYGMNGATIFSIPSLGTADTPNNTNDVLWTDGTTAQDWVNQSVAELVGGTQISSMSGLLDTARPAISSIVFSDSATSNVLAAGDTISITFSEMMDPADIAPTLIPGGAAVTVAEGGIGDVSLEATTGKVTVKGIAVTDIDSGVAPVNTTYTSSISLDATGTVLTIVLNGIDSGSGVLSGNKVFGDGVAIETTLSDVNGNFLLDSGVVASGIIHPAAKIITALSFSDPVAVGTIDENNHTISVVVPFGTNVSALVPAIIKTGALIVPASGVQQDFSNPATYLVTAMNGSTQSYVVTVTVAANPAKALTSLTVQSGPGKPPISAQGVINEADHTVLVYVPYNADVTSLWVTIVHTGATVSPTPGSLQDFTGPITFTVTAADGSAQEYVVTVRVAARPQITSFNVALLGPAPVAVSGVINETDHTIAVTFPYGTIPGSMMTMIEYTGTQIRPMPSSDMAYSPLPMPYTVTAIDGTEQQYSVTVSIAKNSAKAITAFNFGASTVSSTIDETAHTLYVFVPFGTDITALIATIAMTGASIAPLSGVAQNFTTPVSYIVTAEDGSTQRYVVTVRTAKESQVFPDKNGSVSTNKDRPQVVVSSPSQGVTVTTTSDTPKPSINYGSLVSAGTGVIPMTTINTPKARIEIASSTTITSSDVSWDGVMTAPTETTITLPAVQGQTQTVGTAIEMGSSTALLSFDKGVRIVMPGQAGKKAGYVRPSSSFVEIIAVCAQDNQVVGDALAL